ncbi:hypothetical protein IV471_15995 [Enterococcus gallinarum]|uniref:hypothetical protein n=1 Tax=Enterococcus gallinarum TaxID=1353 RepID=UPI001E2D52BA|nr:hypothetical protein [Enterococcus gallinarum]MCD5186736.1 hypothetical protein [Enterococcus gallinarum]MDT2730229.1 hypothetical protein [Enterococcus gallinarum]
MYGNMILAQSITPDPQGNGYFITNPTNSFSVLSTPTFHNLALLFNVSGIDPEKSHSLSLVLRSKTVNRTIINETIPAQFSSHNNLDDPDTIFSMNANIGLGSIQIDHLGRFDLFLYVDNIEICSSPLFFSKAKAIE